MNTVEPIRTMQQVRDMQDYLKEQSERNYIMFVLQLYTALRITDLLQLKVRDVKDKQYITLRESKTRKEQKYLINKKLKGLLDSYIKTKKDYEFLIKSNKGVNKPIKRQQAYRILKDASLVLGIENIGAHSPRKTFGYFHYQKYKDLSELQDIYRHRDISETKRYIGLSQDIKDSRIKQLDFT